MENTPIPVYSTNTVVETLDVDVPFNTSSEGAPVLAAVFRSVFIEVPKEFFGSIGAFFKRYFVHYRNVFKFFHRPSLKATPFEKEDFQKSTRLSFEIVLLFLAGLLFLIKQKWIPVNLALLEAYENDFAEMIIQLSIFFILALAFFAQLLLSVLAGRLLRFIFNLPFSRQKTDILFCFLNNSFFSLAAFAGFFFRLGGQYDEIAGSAAEGGIYMLCFLICFCLVTWWSLRFARLHSFALKKQSLFHPLAIILFTGLYGTGMSALCIFMLGA